jgi:hypothetical protein
VQLLLLYRKRAIQDEKQNRIIYKNAKVSKHDKELSTACKKELFVFLAKDPDYDMRNKVPTIALMDLRVLSTIFDIQFVLFQAETKASQSVALTHYHQRAWLEQLQSIPKLNISSENKKKMFIHFIALSYHTNNMYGYISIKKLETNDHNAAICVKAIATKLDPTLLDDVSAKAKQWIKIVSIRNFLNLLQDNKIGHLRICC